MSIIFQTRSAYVVNVPKPWYSFITMPRGWTDYKNIYINQDAFFLDARDRRLLILHELGHIDGKEHTLFGLMSAYGFVRYLTTFNIMGLRGREVHLFLSAYNY